MDKKTKYYLGLFLLLEHENLLSMSLNLDFRKNLMNGLNLSEKELEENLVKVKDVINFDSSSIYIDFK